jgi:UDP-2,3-diacylglucosamine pyrophosphatase LpxH
MVELVSTKLIIINQQLSTRRRSLAKTQASDSKAEVEKNSNIEKPESNSTLQTFHSRSADALFLGHTAVHAAAFLRLRSSSLARGSFLFDGLSWPVEDRSGVRTTDVSGRCSRPLADARALSEK